MFSRFSSYDKSGKNDRGIFVEVSISVLEAFNVPKYLGHSSTLPSIASISPQS
jgi:hypothetical protein